MSVSYIYQLEVEVGQLKKELETIRNVGKFYLKNNDVLKQKMEKIEKSMEGMDEDAPEDNQRVHQSIKYILKVNQS